jgi:hypothetical protein
VKALINEYYDRGLRMIEIYRHQFRDLSDVIARIKNRNYRYIIFIDDLSFEEDEGGVQIPQGRHRGRRGDPAGQRIDLRHLQPPPPHRETWNDKHDMEHNGELHRSDTVEEKLSLSTRFGVQISYSDPEPRQFLAIVDGAGPPQGPARSTAGRRSTGRGQPLGAAPRRTLRPHGPAVRQLPGGTGGLIRTGQRSRPLFRRQKKGTGPAFAGPVPF